MQRTSVAILAVVFVIVSSGLSPVWAQQSQQSRRPSERTDYVAERTHETIQLGSVRLYLGQSREETLTKLLSAGYRAEPFEQDKNNIAVRWQNTANEWQLLGTIKFADGRITFINKDWNPAKSSDYALAKTLFFATQSLKESGCDSVLIDVSEKDRLGLFVRTVRLRCVGTNRRFQISTFDSDAGTNVSEGRSVSLEEILQLPK